MAFGLLSLNMTFGSLHEALVLVKGGRLVVGDRVGEQEVLHKHGVTLLLMLLFESRTIASLWFMTLGCARSHLLSEKISNLLFNSPIKKFVPQYSRISAILVKHLQVRTLPLGMHLDLLQRVVDHVWRDGVLLHEVEGNAFGTRMEHHDGALATVLIGAEHEVAAVLELLHVGTSFVSQVLYRSCVSAVHLYLARS